MLFSRATYCFAYHLMIYLLRITFDEVNLAMVHLWPVVLLEWYPISYSATCLFEDSSSSEPVSLLYWYPTDFSVDYGYRISW